MNLILFDGVGFFAKNKKKWASSVRKKRVVSWMSSAATKKTFLSGNDQIVEQISVMKLISTEKDPKISKEDCEQIARRLYIDCQRVKVADIYMSESERPLKIVHRP